MRVIHCLCAFAPRLGATPTLTLPHLYTVTAPCAMLSDRCCPAPCRRPKRRP